MHLLLILDKIIGTSFKEWFVTTQKKSNNPGAQCGFNRDKTDLISFSDKAGSLADQENTVDKIHLELKTESDKDS